MQTFMNIQLMNVSSVNLKIVIFQARVKEFLHCPLCFFMTYFKYEQSI